MKIVSKPPENLYFFGRFAPDFLLLLCVIIFKFSESSIVNFIHLIINFELINSSAIIHPQEYLELYTD